MSTTSDDVLERDNYICAYCKGYAACADHVLPKSKGGPNTINNLVAACNSCNNKKSNKFTVEYLVPGFYQILINGGNLDWIDEWRTSKETVLRLSVKTAQENSGLIIQNKSTVVTPVEPQVREKTTRQNKTLLQRCTRCNKFFQRNKSSRCEKCE